MSNKLNPKLFLKIKIIAQAIQVIFSYSPFVFVLFCILIFVHGILPSIIILFTKNLIDIFTNPALSAWTPQLRNGIIQWAAALFIDGTIVTALGLVQSELNFSILEKINIDIIKKITAQADMTIFENPLLYDDMNILKQGAGQKPINFIMNISLVIKNAITIFSLMYILITIQWWVPFVIVASLTPQAYFSWKMYKESWNVMIEKNRDNRIMNDISRVLLSKSHLKEILMYNSSQFFVSRFSSYVQNIHKLIIKKRKQNIFGAYPAIIINALTIIALMLYFTDQALNKNIAFSSIVLLIQSYITLENNFFEFISHVGYSDTMISYFTKFFHFSNESKKTETANINKQKQILPITRIELQNVSFAYPNGTIVLKNINLSCHDAEKIAIVGENGAGKSTLVKLICGLYQPSEGQILINGTNMHDIDMLSYREKIGVIFQECEKYPATVREHINFSENISAKDDAIFSDYFKRIKLCTENEAAALLNSFVGKEYGGIEVSGGEWQKISLARLVNAHKDILILDEPSSALDPLSEAAIFNIFREILNKRIGFLITHRMGSVHLADRIIVLKDVLLKMETTNNYLHKAGTIVKCMQHKHLHCNMMCTEASFPEYQYRKPHAVLTLIPTKKAARMSSFFLH